jgi:hypothetical protein
MIQLAAFMDRMDLLSENGLRIQIAQEVGWSLSLRVLHGTGRRHTWVGGIVGMAMILEVSPWTSGFLLMVAHREG